MSPRDRTLLALAALVLVMAAFVLTSCEPAPYGPPLAGPGCQAGTIELTITLLPNEEELTKWRSAFPPALPPGATVAGFAYQRKADLGTNRHGLVLTVPRGQRDTDRIETWGHELMHSVCGPWHPVVGPK